MIFLSLQAKVHAYVYMHDNVIFAPLQMCITKWSQLQVNIILVLLTFISLTGNVATYVYV